MKSKWFGIGAALSPLPLPCLEIISKE